MRIILMCMSQIPALLVYSARALVGVSESVRRRMFGGMDRGYRMMGIRAIQLITRIISF